MQKVQVTNQQVDAWISDVIEQVKCSGKNYDYIVGIERGGLNLSVPLSDALGIPHKSVKISFYEKDKIELGPFFVEPPPEISGNFSWMPNGLLADDLIDQGKTIAEFKKTFGEIDVAVLLWAQNAKYYRVKPEYFAEFKPEKNWIVFPWE